MQKRNLTTVFVSLKNSTGGKLYLSNEKIVLYRVEAQNKYLHHSRPLQSKITI